MDGDYLFSGLTVDSILTKNLKTIHQETLEFFAIEIYKF